MKNKYTSVIAIIMLLVTTINSFAITTSANIVNESTPINTPPVVPPSRVWINLKGDNNATSQMVLAYLSQCTVGIDFGYDAARFNESNVVSVYSMIGDGAYTIQARPSFTSTDIVQIGYTLPSAGTYTIKIDHSDGVFAQGQHIYIHDSETGETADLTAQDYSFTSQNGVYNNRFTMGYDLEVLNTPVQSLNKALTVYKSGDAINISAPNTVITGIVIYDLSGRVLYNKQGDSGNQVSISSVAAQKQLILVETQTPEGKVTKKMIY